MNKIFKIVFNAARGKMIVVNEATSSVQTGKKAAVTVAVIGALAAGSAMAATEVKDQALSHNGGAVHLVDSMDYVEYSFLNNTAQYAGTQSGLGGAIYSQADSLTVTKSNFVENTATQNPGKGSAKGGAIFKNSGGVLKVTESVFERNHSEKYGGAIGASGAEIEITGSSFVENKSDSNGGVLYIQGGNTTLSGNSFVGNESLGRGGAVLLTENANATFVGQNTFEGNKAGTNGGALNAYKSAGVVTFASESTTVFSNNTAVKLGGAIRNDNQIIFETGSKAEFIGNEAAYGGAIANTDEDKENPIFKLEGSAVFKDNIASGSGGAVLNEGTMTITDSTFTGNSAEKGGAIYNDGVVTLVGTNTFTDNAAAEGDDINNAGTLNIDGTTTIGSGMVSNGTLKLSGKTELVIGADSSISGTFLTEKGSVVTLEDGATVSLNSKAGNSVNDGVIKNLTIQGDGHVDIATSGPALGLGTNTLDVTSVKIALDGNGKAITAYGTNTVTAETITIESEGDGIHAMGDANGSVKLTGDTINIAAGVGGYAIQNASGNEKENIVVNGKDVTLTSDGRTAVSQQGAGSTVVTAENLVIEGFVNGRDDKVNAVNVSKGTLSLTGTETVSISNGKGDATTNAIGVEAAGTLNVKGGDVTINGTTKVEGAMSVEANTIAMASSTVGLNSRNGAQVTLGSDETESVSITINPTDPDGVYAMGIQVRNPDTSVTVKGNQLNVTVGGGENDTSVGVLVQGNADGKSGTKMGELNLDSLNTQIVAVDNAMAAYAAGVLNVTGNLTATAENVVEARGQSTVNINTAGGKDVVLNGDINFNKGVASGTDAWADVNVVLDTAASVWNGNVKATWDVPATAEDFAGSKLNLTLANGAQWNPQSIEAVGSLGEATTFALRRSGPTDQGQFALDVNSLTMEGGVLNLEDGVQVGVDNLEGSGGTVNLGTTNGETGAGLDVGTLSDETKLDVNLMNADLSKELTSDDLTPEQAQELLKNVAGGSESVTTQVEEGLYNDAFTVNGQDGVVATTTNSIMSNVLDLASNGTLSLNRVALNDVRKRMGDLRAAEGTHGVWARYNGGKLSGARGFENEFTTIQVGIDTVPVVDAPRFGVAFSYTKSDADMKRGGAEMDAYSLAFYGTKMYDNGMFVDVIGRMATADTDLTVNVDGQKTGSMDNVALSLSGEFGWRFDVTDTFYVEPQAELTYTYVNSDTLTMSGGAAYKFDAVDSLMGRVGFAAGFKCPDNFGDVYVRASVVHEFLGDSAVTGRNGNTLELNGEDTWVEFGIGANFNLNKSTYVYVDIERTEGAKLEEDWRANVGVRYAF